MRHTSPRASTQMPPSPTTRTGPHCGSRRAPTTISTPRRAMRSTSTPSRIKFGWASAMDRCSCVQASRSLGLVADVENDAAHVTLVANADACALSATGNPTARAQLQASSTLLASRPSGTRMPTIARNCLLRYSGITPVSETRSAPAQSRAVVRGWPASTVRTLSRAPSHAARGRATETAQDPRS